MAITVPGKMADCPDRSSVQDPLQLGVADGKSYPLVLGHSPYFSTLMGKCRSISKPHLAWWDLPRVECEVLKPLVPSSQSSIEWLVFGCKEQPSQ